MEAGRGGVERDCSGLKPLPTMDGRRAALTAFRANLPEITAAALRLFEDLPVTADEVRAVRDGEALSSIHHLDGVGRLQVRNFHDAAEGLLGMDAFRLDADHLAALHAACAREDALTWGVFRTSPVTIAGSDRLPPEPEDFPGLADRGFRFLREAVSDPRERAVAAFLFTARSQFFFDANKRTGLLAMEGVLLAAGFPPLILPADEAGARNPEGATGFYARLRDFYRTGDAAPMMRFFAKRVRAVTGHRAKA